MRGIDRVGCVGASPLSSSSCDAEPVLRIVAKTAGKPKWSASSRPVWNGSKCWVPLCSTPFSLACGRALSLQVWRGSAAGTADALLREGLLLEHAAALGALAQLAIPAGLVIPLPGLRGGLGDFALADSSVGALAAQGGDPFLERATM